MYAYLWIILNAGLRLYIQFQIPSSYNFAK